MVKKIEKGCRYTKKTVCITAKSTGIVKVSIFTITLYMIQIL